MDRLVLVATLLREPSVDGVTHLLLSASAAGLHSFGALAPHLDADIAPRWRRTFGPRALVPPDAIADALMEVARHQGCEGPAICDCASLLKELGYRVLPFAHGLAQSPDPLYGRLGEILLEVATEERDAIAADHRRKGRPWTLGSAPPVG